MEETEYDPEHRRIIRRQKRVPEGSDAESDTTEDEGAIRVIEPAPPSQGIARSAREQLGLEPRRDRERDRERERELVYGRDPRRSGGV
jgi:hypothetical protein